MTTPREGSWYMMDTRKLLILGPFPEDQLRAMVVALSDLDLAFHHVRNGAFGPWAKASEWKTKSVWNAETVVGTLNADSEPTVMPQMPQHTTTVMDDERTERAETVVSRAMASPTVTPTAKPTAKPTATTTTTSTPPPPNVKGGSRIERRKHQRYEARLRVVLTLGQICFRTYTTDVSLGGFHLEAPVPKALLDRPCEIYLALPGGNENIVFTASLAGDSKNPLRFKFGQTPAEALRILRSWIERFKAAA